MARYHGTDDFVSPTQVQRFLKDNFVHEDGSRLDDENELVALTSTQEAIAIMRDGAEFTSSVYYVGDRIADMYKFLDIPIDDDEGDEEDDDGE